MNVAASIASGLLALMASAGVAGVLGKRALDRFRRRVERLSAQAEALSRGDTPPFEVATADGSIGVLERNMSALTAYASARAAATRAEVSRQRLDAQVQRALSMAETEDEALDIASRAFSQAAPECPSELLLANEAESELHLATISAAGSPGCPVSSPSGCPAMRMGQTLRFFDENALDVCPHLRSRSGGAKNAVCVPLAPTRGTTGVLHATSDDGPLHEESIARLESIASHVGTRLRVLHVLSVFQTQAETDALTGLLNRRSFEQRAASLLRSNRSLAIAIADLDHFKMLNDSHGHAAGDHALRVFARAARTFASERSGFAARLGGEEFVIVLPMSREDASAKVFDDLRTALRNATRNGAAPSFTVSIGVSVFPLHGANLSELLGAADRALYQAKSRGRDRVVLHGTPSAPPDSETSRRSA